MSASDQGAASPSILGGTLKVVASVALVAVAGATWLSGTTGDKSGQSRLTSALSRGFDEPATTGSIGSGANATRLDPCTAPAAAVRAR